MVDHIRSSVSLLAVGLLVSALGCGDKAADGGAGSAKPATTSTAAKTAATTAKTAAPAPTAKPVEMIDFDLEQGEPKWKGWTAKGPSDAKMLKDGMDGVRIAAKGGGIMKKEGEDEGFDMSFGWGKKNLKELKANIEKGAAASEGKSVLTFMTDTPELLEWKSVYDGKRTSYNFVMNFNVEKTDVFCKNNYMVGSGNEAEHKRIMEACKTLAKKK
jgi:hypothetical protein